MALSTKRRVVFLDRDGTLIEDRIYLNDPEQVFFLPGAFEALKLLRDLNFSFAIATNQSGVARGIVDIGNLREIHRRMRGKMSEQGIDVLDFYYAPYMTDSGHWMRKPNPGMLLTAAHDYNVDLKASWMIGDRMSDVEAGHRAGTRSILLNRGTLTGQEGYSAPEAIVSNLLEAAHFIAQVVQNETVINKKP